MAKQKKEKRFEVVYTQGSVLASSMASIIVDKETGVNYLFHQSGYAGGLTPLLDKNGNVVVSDVSEEA